MRQGTFIGVLGRDWEAKTVGQYTMFESSLAVKCGKDNKDTMWVKLAQWGEKPGEVMQKYSGKGCKIAVIGDIEVRAYKDKNGDAKPDLSVRVTGFEFLTFKEDKAEEAKPEPVPEEIPFN